MECCAQYAPDKEIDVYGRKCRTEGCGKQPSLGVPGTNTVEYCTEHAPDPMVGVFSRKCRTKGCVKGQSFGVAGTKTGEYCTQNAANGMVDACSRKCRAGDCDKKPPFRVTNTRTMEYCAQHARLNCVVEAYGKVEVGPHHSGKETIGNIIPNDANHQTVHPPATTSPPSDSSQGSHKRVRYPETTSAASMRPISRELAGGARTMPDIVGQTSPVKRESSLKTEVQLSL